MQARLTGVSKEQADSDTNLCYETIYWRCTHKWNYKNGYKLWVSVDKRMLCEMPLKEGGEMQCLNAKGCTPVGITFLPKDSYTSCDIASSAATKPICDGLDVTPTSTNPNNYAAGAHCKILPLLVLSAI